MVKHYTDPVRLSSSGIRQFFAPPSLNGAELSIAGIGIREVMPPCMITRPHGTGDYLLMLFHDSATMDAKVSGGKLESPDTLMIWPPGKAQYYGNLKKDFSHSWIHCKGSLVPKILRSSRLPVLKPLAVRRAPHWQRSLLEIHSELVSYTRPDPVIVRNLLENSLRELARDVISPGKNLKISDNLLAVRKLIGTAPIRSLSLREMAKMAGMSIPYFCACFKKSFGLSPVDCLIRHRMYHASHLLMNQNLNITEVARQVGYEDLFQFSKSFKKHFGHSPREMRRRQNLLKRPS